MEVMQCCFLVLLTHCIWFGLLPAECGRFDPNTVKPLGSPPDRILNVTELIDYYGYKGKRYEAVTEDGYILGMTRILNGTGFPVLFVHGLTISPEMWVIHGPGHDLAFVMSELGYDVWLGGQRGVAGSWGHTSLNMAQPEYWDFSHEEQGSYDLPAMIDLVLSESGRDKLYFVGVSLSSTMFAVMCSERPEHCRSVAGSFHYVPAMLLPRRDQFPPHNQFFSLLLSQFVAFLKWLHVPFFMFPQEIRFWFKDFCDTSFGNNVCYLTALIIAGLEKSNIDEEWLSYTAYPSGSGTSLRQMEHLMQLLNTGGLRKFDFGRSENLRRYGSVSPPSHNLSTVTSPTGILYSQHDAIIPKKVMEKILASVANLKYSRPLENLGHAAVVIGQDIYQQFGDVVDFFDGLSGLNN